MDLSIEKWSVWVSVLQIWALSMTGDITRPIGDDMFLFKFQSCSYARISSCNGGLSVWIIPGGISIHPLSIVLRPAELETIQTFSNFAKSLLSSVSIHPLVWWPLDDTDPCPRRLTPNFHAREYQWVAMVDLSLENNGVRICPL
jgi:hypothetical protein